MLNQNIECNLWDQILDFVLGMHFLAIKIRLKVWRIPEIDLKVSSWDFKLFNRKLLNLTLLDQQW